MIVIDIICWIITLLNIGLALILIIDWWMGRHSRSWAAMQIETAARHADRQLRRVTNDAIRDMLDAVREQR